MYNSLESKVSEKEWLRALKKTKPKSVLGLSSISYSLIKKVEPAIHKKYLDIWQICASLKEKS